MSQEKKSSKVYEVYLGTENLFYFTSLESVYYTLEKLRTKYTLVGFTEYSCINGKDYIDRNLRRFNV